MFTMFPKLYKLFVFSTFISGIKCKTQWIDPYSMFDEPADGGCGNAVQNYDPSDHILFKTHYIRTLNLILNAVKYDHLDREHRAHFDVRLQQDEVDFMKEFLQGPMSDTRSWDRMDKLLTTMFVNQKDTIFTEFLTWTQYLCSVASSTEFRVAICVIVALWIIYKVKHMHITAGKLFGFFLFVAFVIDFIFTWVYILKEEELKQLLKVAHSVPPECNVAKMSWMEYTKYLLSNTDRCHEYHVQTKIDYYWAVSPLTVLTTQFGNVVLAPAEKIGSAYAKLINGVFQNTSWIILIPTTFLVPVFLLILVLSGCILLSSVTGREVGFNFFHIIQFKYGGTNTTAAATSTPQLTSHGNPVTASQSQPQINVVLPAVTVTASRRRLRAADEKKTPTPSQTKMAPALPAAAIQETPHVEDIEETCFGDDETDSDITVLSGDGSEGKPSENDEDTLEYEVIK